MMRKYTVSEIDELRKACQNKYLYGDYRKCIGFSRTYTEGDMLVAVEQMVRTHMLAGHTPADLIGGEIKCR